MLVLTRKKDQSVIIDDKIEITVIEIKGDQIRLGINAPKDVTILRKEIYQEVQEENRSALNTSDINLTSLAEIIRKK